MFDENQAVAPGLPNPGDAMPCLDAIDAEMPCRNLDTARAASPPRLSPGTTRTRRNLRYGLDVVAQAIGRRMPGCLIGLSDLGVA